MTNALKAAALKYAAMGYRVFPCRPLTKRPFTQKGFHDATTDVQTIERWWREEPQANVAIATDNLLVLDLDPQSGDWPGTEKAVDLWNAGAIASTPRGGRHFFFCRPAGKQWRCTSGKLATGVDTRTTGGYVLVAPSSTTEGQYAWTRPLEVHYNCLSPPPLWLEKLLDSHDEVRVSFGEGIEGIPEGQRNSWLTSMAGSLRRRGLGYEAILETLIPLNKAMCRPPLSVEEVKRIAASVSRYPTGEEEVKFNGGGKGNSNVPESCNGNEGESEEENEEEEEDIPQAERLVRLALQLFRIGVTDSNEPFAVPKSGPNVAKVFRGGQESFRAALAYEYRKIYGRPPSNSALVDALTFLQGESLRATPENVFLRVAENEGNLLIDLGTPQGQVVEIVPGSWRILPQSPVLFRRTALTSPLPEPQSGDLDILAGLLRLPDDTWHLLKGWLVAALFPSIPHPILLLGGEQGAGKTTTAKLLASVIDPSSAPVRSEPKDIEGWVLAATGGWVVAVDNVSGISPWWSDALCRAVTGDGWIRRRLYTDSELTVLSFRRAIILTGIDVGVLRGDLGDRLLLGDLVSIPSGNRKTEGEIMAAFTANHAKIFGGLLDLAARVLEILPRITLPELPRMADFGRILAAVDALEGRQTLESYLQQNTRIANEVIEADPVAQSILSLMSTRYYWEGTATDLMNQIQPSGLKPPPGWPTSPRGLSAKLIKLATVLRSQGIEVHRERAGHDRARKITLIRKRDIEN